MAFIEDKATRRFGQMVHCLGGLLTLAAAVVAYAVFYAPATTATERARTRIDEFQVALEQAPAIARRHARLSRQLQEMEQDLAAVRRRVPKQAEESEFLAAMTSLADEVGFVVTNLSPDTPKHKAGYSQMDISITGLADYEGLCRFVEGIAAFPRLTRVVGLDVRHDPGGQGMYPVTITAAIFFDLGVDPDAEE